MPLLTTHGARTPTNDDYALWLTQFKWDHFCTLTAPPSCDDKLRAGFAKAVRRLERVAHRAVGWYFVRERGAAGTPHLHALLEGTAHLTCAQIVRAWKLGHADVKPFDMQQGGVSYLTKTLAEPDAIWDVSKRLTSFDAYLANANERHPASTTDLFFDLPGGDGLGDAEALEDADGFSVGGSCDADQEDEFVLPF